MLPIRRLFAWFCFDYYNHVHSQYQQSRMSREGAENARREEGWGDLRLLQPGGCLPGSVLIKLSC